jgi:MFS transporter, UMF1 family
LTEKFRTERPTYSQQEQRGWCWYDVANSVFFTSGIALFLPAYVPTLAAAGADATGYLHILGVPILAASFWPYVVGLAVFLQVLVLPIIGALADYGRRKRELLLWTAAIGSVAAAAMVTLEGAHYLRAAALFIVANLSIGASVVIYNSFLPEIAPPDERDRLSSRGWALGYVGGCVMLIVHLGLLNAAPQLGISTSIAVRIALCSTGVWWILWTIPAYRALRNRGEARSLPPGQSTLGVAFSQLWHTVRDMRRYPQTVRFLIAYLLYNDAIQTVLVVSAQFGSQEVGLAVTQLTITILISQFVGVCGAVFFQRLAERITAKTAVIVALVIWIALLLYAYRFVDTALEFYVMGGCAGLVMGGSQALSRSIFAQLVPEGKEAEYFSIYEVGDKGTSWLGPPTFGLALQWTGSYRIAILSLLVFFISGLAVLTRADVKQGEWDVLKGA